MSKAEAFSVLLSKTSTPFFGEGVTDRDRENDVLRLILSIDEWKHARTRRTFRNNRKKTNAEMMFLRRLRVF